MYFVKNTMPKHIHFSWKKIKEQLLGLLFSSTHFLTVIVQSYAVAVFSFCIVPVVIGVVHVKIEVGGDNIQLEADFVFFFYGRKFAKRKKKRRILLWDRGDSYKEYLVFEARHGDERNF